MSERAGVVAGAPLRRDTREVEGVLVDVNGRRFYRIANHDAMPPFFMSLVSDSDHWLFASSNGALTAGRRDPDGALFPYTTDDRIHDSQDQAGAKTLLRVARGRKVSLWEPFSQRYEGLYRVRRDLYKSTVGNELMFEETNTDLGLVFRYAWTTSERFGFVRHAMLLNTGGTPAKIEVLDGVLNLLAAGLGRRFQMEYSTLADGYKEAELDAATGLGIFRLSSVPIDKAEPSEALRATTAWSLGLEPAIRLLSATQLDRFRLGAGVEQETNVRGRRGAYFVQASVSLAKGGRKDWRIVCDVEQDACAVRATLANLTKGEALRGEVEADVERGTQSLVRIVASADGLQATGDELSARRHFSNVLFNVMRGGIPDRGYRIARDDLASFLRKANRPVAERQAAFVSALPETLPHARLLTLAREQGDPDLERLVHEYLPLTFSRRHGDPSRPWNVFAIEVKDEHGQKVLNYQGNWRDIFQNWEALALSFPGYVESMIFKFVDASTADGHNPYRVTRDGFDWEVVDPHDPWSHIGYWGDHQVVYLLKLLEVSSRYHPGALEGLLHRRVFSYADVPYRIRSYEKLLEDPHETIDFDWDAHRTAMSRVEELGGDGRSLSDGKGGLYRATLGEKLLVVALAKLFNFVPEAGIWMNTQRPEWNDANNALVGYGVSMVTLCYLRRFVSFCQPLFAQARADGVEVSAELAFAFRGVSEALARHEGLLTGPISDQDRKRVLDDLGRVGSAYRQRIYAGLAGERQTLAGPEIEAFCARVVRHLDHSIRANRRADGLYHSYNLMKVDGGTRVVVRRLYEMLEGQVAVLASGALTPGDAAALLDRLAASALYRADQKSYILYPDRRLPRFLEKNNIPTSAVAASRLLTEMLRRGDRRIVAKDVNGGVHFDAAFRNASPLRAALEALRGGELGPLAEQEAPGILALYEELFDHQSFTGRSGTFYKYEGLGCIYWHMVSKLLLAVQDLRAAAGGASPAIRRRLQEHYEAIREGIGVHKTPTEYGAIPTDPYSHTPGFAGVQQPGMTGQVKEDILARFAEMGACVDAGRLVFRADLFRAGELRKTAGRFEYLDVAGEPRVLDLPKGSLAFTTCQVPVVVHRTGPAHVELTLSDGSGRKVAGLELDPETSAALFERTGRIRRVDVFFGIA
jgi:hypothetical protein